MKISMIAAMTQDRVIGTGTSVPWHLPRDSQHLRDYTLGKPMLLGRQTYEEMTGWFTTQHPIVLTRQKDYTTEDALVVHDVPAALSAARAMNEGDAHELVVVGGAQVYAVALPLATDLILTLVDTRVDGPARFPDFQECGVWQCLRREPHPADADHAHPFEFQYWERQG